MSDDLVDCVAAFGFDGGIQAPTGKTVSNIVDSKECTGSVGRMNTTRFALLFFMIVSAVFAAETNQKNQSVANQPAANAAKEVLPKRPVEEIHQVRNETFRLIVATLGGGCVAAFLSNWLTVRRERGRDRDQRMREFRGYLAEVESRIERFSDDLKDPDAVKKMWDGYVNLVHMFHRERAKVMTDFQPAPEFDGLCETFGRLQHKHVTEAGKPRDVLAESLKSLTAFTRLRA